MGAVLDPASGSLGHDALGALQAFAALALVGLVAWLAWRALRTARSTRRSDLLQVEARLPLDLRQALLIVRVEQRRLLLATSDHGPPRLITELAPGPPLPDDASARRAPPAGDAP